MHSIHILLNGDKVADSCKQTRQDVGYTKALEPRAAPVRLTWQVAVPKIVG